MAQKLPDEILILIAKECVEPYQITFLHTSKARGDPRGYGPMKWGIKNFPGLTNLKQVNQLF